MVKKITKTISSSFEENIDFMDRVLPVEESFDIIRRNMDIGGRNAVFYFIDGFVKDETMLKLMTSFITLTEKTMPTDASLFCKKCVLMWRWMFWETLTRSSEIFCQGRRSCL